ncbi:MAG: hypothetical protein ABI895_02175 [Deltaproteobacteria bacterium]
MAARSVSQFVLLLVGGCAAGAGHLPAAAAADASGESQLAPIALRELVVTAGSIEIEPGGAGGGEPTLDRFLIRSPLLRAWVGRQPRASVELSFAYLGPTAVLVPLRSGEQRRQIGLELRAQDGCNLVYVMWHIEPLARLVVSLKSNPGQHQHSECADRGYVSLEPEQSRALPQLELGQRHVLRATLLASAPSQLQLDVQVDGVSHWRGRLPAAAVRLEGPVGLRSDNGQFDVQLRAARPGR